MKLILTFFLFTFISIFCYSQDENIYFDTDKHDIRNSEINKLEIIHNKYLRGNFKLLLVGHCDEAGSNYYNIELSKKRVNKVRDYFVNIGIPSDRIQLDYQGEIRADRVAQEYRKVEIFLVREKLVEVVEEEVELEVQEIYTEEHRDVSEIKPEDEVISSRDFERMQEGWKVTYDTYIDSIKPKAEIHKISNDDSHIIYGEKGTMIKIPENAFVYENGEAARGEIVFKLTEYYSKKEFISNRLSTISKGNLIKSAGMIELEAKSMNYNLKLAEGKELEILFPKMDKAYSTFYGERLDDGSMEWEIDEKYTKAKELNLDDYGVTTSEDGEGLELVEKKEAKKRNKKAKFKGMDGIFIEVTPEYLDSLEKVNEEKLARWEAGEKVRTKITSRNLGFINCDRFMDEKTSDTEILVQIMNENVDALNAFLVFKDLNSMIEIRQQEDNIFFYNALLPLGREVDLIVVGKDENDALYFHQSTMKLAGEINKNINLKESSYDKMDELLSGL